MERIPGAIPLYMGTNRCFATVVLSNLGDMGRHFGAQFPCESGKIVAGNLILEDIFGAPRFAPTRGPPSWSAGMAGVSGSASAVIRGCSLRTTHADCSRFTSTASQTQWAGRPETPMSGAILFDTRLADSKVNQERSLHRFFPAGQDARLLGPHVTRSPVRRPENLRRYAGNGCRWQHEHARQAA